MKEFLIALVLVGYYAWAFLFLFCRWWGNPWTGKPGKFSKKSPEEPKKMINLVVGDKVWVRGEAFILVEHTKKINQPSRVEFKQPVELINHGYEFEKITGAYKH